MTTKVDNEIAHGRYLAAHGATELWGWGTPAGERRATRRAALIAEGSRLGPETRALEVGCGTGLFTGLFAESGARIIAVDISEELLEQARARTYPGDRVAFLEARFEDCHERGPFDAIVGSSVLHHLDIEPALRRMYELLVPGGRICFAEPNYLNPQVFIERRFRRFFPQVSPDETAFVRWTLGRLLTDTGFEDVHIRPFDWLHPATPSGWIDLVSRIGLGLEKIPLVKEFSGSLLIQARRQGQE